MSDPISYGDFVAECLRSPTDERLSVTAAGSSLLRVWFFYVMSLSSLRKVGGPTPRCSLVPEITLGGVPGTFLYQES